MVRGHSVCILTNLATAMKLLGLLVSDVEELRIPGRHLQPFTPNDKKVVNSLAKRLVFAKNARLRHELEEMCRMGVKVELEAAIDTVGIEQFALRLKERIDQRAWVAEEVE